MSSRSPAAEALHVLAVTLLAAGVTVSFIRPASTHNGLNQYERSRFLAMVDGTAHRPFVTRVLLPVTVRAVDAATPAAVRDAAARWARERELPRRAFAELHWESAAAWRYLVALLLMVACFTGFGLVMARWLAAACGLRDDPRTRTALGALALAGVVPLFSYNAFPYDPPQLLLFALALHALLAGRRGVFMAAFALACVNKETAVLLVPLAAWAWGREVGARAAWGRAAGLALGWLVVRGAIAWARRDTPGSLIEAHLFHNLRWLTGARSVPDLLSAVALAALVGLGWRAAPALVRRAFVWTLVPLASLALFLGFVDEWRGYFEAYPAGLALVMLGARRGWRALAVPPARPA